MAVDRILKSLMGNNLPFGGKVVLMAGDFRQKGENVVMPPVLL